MKKKILIFMLSICFIIPTIFCLSGCGKTTLKNGNYKVTAYSIDGQSETNYINSYASINGNTLTDWLNNTASIQIKGKTIELTWSGYSLTLTGSVSNDIITINEEVNGREYLIVLTYEENVVLKNGNYKVTAYSIDGQSETNYINSYASINGNTLTDWLNNTASIQIKGKTIELTWSGYSLTLTGSVSNDIITINEEVNGSEYLIVLTYENN